MLRRYLEVCDHLRVSNAESRNCNPHMSASREVLGAPIVHLAGRIAKSCQCSPLSTMYSRSIDRGALEHMTVIGDARMELDGDSAMIGNRMPGLEWAHEGTGGPDAAELKRRSVVGLNGLPASGTHIVTLGHVWLVLD